MLVVQAVADLMVLVLLVQVELGIHLPLRRLRAIVEVPVCPVRLLRGEVAAVLPEQVLVVPRAVPAAQEHHQA